MSDTGLILVVDDDADLLLAHSLFVKSLGYEALTATNGQEALELVRQQGDGVDLILADVMMPVMDGYEFCRILKSELETADIPVLFVTAADTLEEKIKGFDVGAEDYIIKPVTPDSLGRKLRVLMEHRAGNKALRQQLSETQSVAMQAMTYSGDLGQVLEFYKYAIDATSFGELAELLFNVTNNYGLNCTLQVITPNKVLNFGHKGYVTPLEMNVIELGRNKGRFFDFGPRTLINFNDFSLLAKNMPLENPERYGLIKDSLANLCNAVEASVKFLLYQNAAMQKEQIVSTVLGVLEQIDGAFTRMQEENAAVINHVIDEMDEAMMDMGLTPDQEDMIRNIILKGREKSEQVLRDGVALYDLFEQVRAQLDRVLSKKQ